MDKAIIEFNQVSKTYQNGSIKNVVLEDISFDVKTNEIVSIIGPNGSGKSTLIKLALDILENDSGNIIRNNNYFNETGYIPQDYRNGLFPWINLYKNIAINLNDNTNLFRPRIKLKHLISFYKNAQSFNIKYNLRKYPYQLSGGEQQIFLFLQLIQKEPKLIIADELFSAIDVKRKESIILFFIDWLKQKNIPLLFVTHDIRDALIMSDKIIILNRNSPSIKEIINIDKPFPRKAEWMFSEEYNAILKYMTECLE